MAQTEERTESVVKVLGIHHAGILCNDLDRAVDFYSRVLGMELVGTYRSSDGRAHFTGANLPPEVEKKVDIVEAQRDFEEYLGAYRQARPGRTPKTVFARMRCGNEEVVLFERPEPLEGDTLIENGIFHQSFRISAEHMAHLVELKRRGDSGIRFHTGPAIRWPHGRALYLWDTEGNYIELESHEDLRAEYGVEK